jgi:hypothetical protein
MRSLSSYLQKVAAFVISLPSGASRACQDMPKGEKHNLLGVFWAPAKSKPGIDQIEPARSGRRSATRQHLFRGLAEQLHRTFESSGGS